MRKLASAGLGLLLLLPGAGASTLAQSDAGTAAPPSPSPSPSAPGLVPSGSPGALSELHEDSAESDASPSWRRLPVTRGPAAREDHTWTVDAAGRFAYLFGGRDGPRSFGDLWRYDLETDTWRRLSPRGPKPSPRFGHNAVWVDGTGLVVFAGQRGADFFGDLWTYDPARERWTRLPAQGAVPKPRYGSCMVVGEDGRVWISHGFTFAGRFDDTRAYNLRSRRWTSIAPGGRRPGERCLHDCFTSSSGELVLFGGQDDTHIALGDLWLKRNDGSWRRQPDPRPDARRLYGLAEVAGEAWIFGGTGADGRALDDLWRVDRDTLEFQRVAVDGFGPSARYASSLIGDPSRGRLLLFGGQSAEARDDVWELRDSIARPDSAEQLDSVEPDGAESSGGPAPAGSLSPTGSPAPEDTLEPAVGAG